jgi:hypothetical protein
MLPKLKLRQRLDAICLNELLTQMQNNFIDMML